MNQILVPLFLVLLSFNLSAQQPGMKLFDPTGEVDIFKKGKDYDEIIELWKILYREKFITVHIDEQEGEAITTYYKLPMVTYHLEPDGEIYAEIREDGNFYIKGKLVCTSDYHKRDGHKVDAPFFRTLKNTGTKNPWPSTCDEAESFFSAGAPQKGVFKTTTSRHETASNGFAIIADDYQGEWGVIHDATEDGKPLYFKYAESSVPKTHFAYPGARPFDFINKVKYGAREKMAQKAQDLEQEPLVNDPKANQMMIDFLNGKLPEGENWVSYIEDDRIILLYYDPDHPLPADDKHYLGSNAPNSSLKFFSYNFSKDSPFYTPSAVTHGGYETLYATMSIWWRHDNEKKERETKKK